MMTWQRKRNKLLLAVRERSVKKRQKLKQGKKMKERKKERKRR